MPNLLSWSPAGDLIAFASENRQYASAFEPGNIAPSAIMVVSAEGGDPRVVVPAEWVNQSPTWLPDGRLVFVSDRNGVRDLYIQSLDGDPQASPRRLTTGLDLLTAEISRDGSRLAYDVPKIESNIWTIPIPDDSMAPVPISGAEKLTTGNQWIETIGLSRNGEWIAFDSNRTGNQDIYRMNVDGGEQIQLTRHPANDFAPAWSPGGDEIVFYSFRGGVRQLFQMDTHGRHVRRVTSTPGTEVFATWSADGNTLAYVHATDRYRSVLYQVSRADAGQPWSVPELMLDEEVHTPPRWSPDGSRIAFLGVDSRIRLFDPTTGESATLSTEVLGTPVWAPDSRSVYVVGMVGDQTGIWRIRVRDARLDLLVSIPEKLTRRRWLDTDGKRFFFTQVNTRDSDLWVVDLEASP